MAIDFAKYNESGTRYNSKTEFLHERKAEVFGAMKGMMENDADDWSPDDEKRFDQLDDEIRGIDDAITLDEKRGEHRARLQLLESGQLPDDCRGQAQAGDTKRDALALWCAAAMLGRGDTEASRRCCELAGIERRNLFVTDPSSGGTTVPRQLRPELLRLRQEVGVVRGLSTTIPMTTKVIDIPDLTTAPTANIFEEGETITQSDPVTGIQQMTARVYAAHTIASLQLIQDSSLEWGRIYLQLLIEAIGRKEDSEALEGTGEKVDGIKNVAGTGSVAVAAALATLDPFVQALRVLGEADETAVNNASWIVSPLAWQQIQQLKHPGYSGDTAGEYMVTSQPISGTPLALFGRPVFLSNQISNGSGDADSTAYLGDFKRGCYYGDRDGPSFLNDPYSRSTTLEVIFRVHSRTAIQIVLPAAFVKITGLDLS